MAEMESASAGLAEESIVGSMAKADEGIATAAVPEGAGLVSNAQAPVLVTGTTSEPYTLEMNDEDLPLLKQQLESFTGTCRELGLFRTRQGRRKVRVRPNRNWIGAKQPA